MKSFLIVTIFTFYAVFLFAQTEPSSLTTDTELQILSDTSLYNTMTKTVLLENTFNNLRMMVKDTALYNAIIMGDISIPAVESGLKSRVYPSERALRYPVRIAIDPGHVARNRREAYIEERIIEKSKTKNQPKISFFESKLTMATAKLIADQLTYQGYQVMLTREWGGTSFGSSYTKWFKKDRKTFLKNDLEKGRITEEQYDRFLSLGKRELFVQYFNFLDLKNRIDKINNFNPDLTLVLHFNASEGFKAEKGTDAPIVNSNYAVFFIPGGFTNSELAAPSQAEDVRRLVGTETVGLSQLLSASVAKELIKVYPVETMKLTPLDTPSTIGWVNKYAIRTSEPGVFARNLYLTRGIKSPVCYAEPFLQNNNKMIYLLNQKSLDVHGMKVSPFLQTVAKAYIDGIKNYMRVGSFIVRF